MLLVILLRFFKFCEIKRGARHLIENRAYAVDCSEILGILLQHLLKFRDGLCAASHIFLGWSARNVKAWHRQSQIQAGHQQVGIKFRGALKSSIAESDCPFLKAATPLFRRSRAFNCCNPKHLLRGSTAPPRPQCGGQFEPLHESSKHPSLARIHIRPARGITSVFVGPSFLEKLMALLQPRRHQSY